MGGFHVSRFGSVHEGLNDKRCRKVMPNNLFVTGAMKPSNAKSNTWYKVQYRMKVTCQVRRKPEQFISSPYYNN